MVTANGSVNEVTDNCAEPITANGRINAVTDDYTGSMIISVIQSINEVTDCTESFQITASGSINKVHGVCDNHYERVHQRDHGQLRGARDDQVERAHQHGDG